jgi:hypothetical protein
MAVQIGAAGTVAENAALDLSDFAEEAGGALAPGWYKATIVEGYSTTKGKQIITGDNVSSKGDSRNMKVCFSLTGVGRNLFESFNYRTSDFTPERLAQIKELRDQFKGTRGAWPGNADAQRSSLAIAQLAQLQKAVGLSIPRTDAGNLNPIPFVGHSLDVRVNVDEKGYNNLTAFAAAGTRVKS